MSDEKDAQIAALKDVIVKFSEKLMFPPVQVITKHGEDCPGHFPPKPDEPFCASCLEKKSDCECDEETEKLLTEILRQAQIWEVGEHNEASQGVLLKIMEMIRNYREEPQWSI